MKSFVFYICVMGIMGKCGLFSFTLKIILLWHKVGQGFFWGGEGGREGAFAPFKKVLPPLSQRDLPHTLPDVFSCYPPRFLVCVVHPPCQAF